MIKAKEVKGKVSCPHCGKMFTHVNKHVPSCPENPDQAKRTGRVTDKPRTKATTPPARASSSTAPTHEGQKEEARTPDAVPASRGDSTVSKSLTPDDDGIVPGSSSRSASSSADDAPVPGSSSRSASSPADDVPVPGSSSRSASSAADDAPVAGSSSRSASSALGNKVKLAKDDIKEGSEALNRFKEHIIERLNTVSKPITWTVQTAGSYYDRTKIGKVDEFDLVLLASISCEAEFETSSDLKGYCRLRPDNKGLLTILIDSDGYLCPRKFREFANDKLTMAVDETTVRLNRRIKRLHQSEDCPAFTVDYDCGNGKHLVIDLVPAIPMTGWPSISDWSIPSWASSVINRNELKKGYECVTKWHPTERDQPLWHVSFTKCSQLLWKHADGKEKTCRKLTLKVFKLKLDELKEKTVVKHITSHQLRHCLFKAFDQHPDVQYWAERNKGTCITDVQNLIIQCFKDRKLDNYFVQGYNLLRNVPEKEVKCFVDHLMHNTSHNL